MNCNLGECSTGIPFIVKRPEVVSFKWSLKPVNVLIFYNAFIQFRFKFGCRLICRCQHLQINVSYTDVQPILYQWHTQIYYQWYI